MKQTQTINYKQQKLVDERGTPEKFEDAVWRACDDMFITTNEAFKAIRKYKKEWYDAGKSTS